MIRELGINPVMYMYKSVVLNLFGGIEPRKLYTCIHQALRSWKNKMHFFVQVQSICI